MLRLHESPGLVPAGGAPIPVTQAASRLLAGDGEVPGNSVDPDYAHGIGRGGLNGETGGNGMAVFQIYVPQQSERPRTTFYYSGTPEDFIVPQSSVHGAEVQYVVIKLWGAGGGVTSAGRGQAHHRYHAIIPHGPGARAAA